MSASARRCASRWARVRAPPRLGDCARTLGVGLVGHQVVAVGRYLDHAAVLRELAQPRIVHVARMCEHRARARMREDDGRTRELEQLVEHVIRGVRRVEQDAEAICLLHVVATERLRPCQRGPSGSVLESPRSLLRKCTGPGDAHAEPVVRVEQREIGAYRVAVLHAEEHHAALACRDAHRIVRGVRELELARIRGNHLVDFLQPQESGVARGGASLGR